MLLGIDWDFENYPTIDFKKELVTFYVEGFRVIQPLDPYQGPRFIEHTDNKEEPELLDQLYILTIGRR